LERGLDGDVPIDPIAVFDRDGWRCYICGVATPKDLRGSFDDMAPELEHKIALANGGLHILSNVACACRRCNLNKGHKKILNQINDIGAGV
jgi:5-methylcytosine-specific restriction endonuclease McrA